MKVKLTLLLIALGIKSFAQPSPEKVIERGKVNFIQTPAFIENKGQIGDMDNNPRPDVKAMYQSDNLTIFLLPTGLAYQFHETHYPEGYKLPNKFSQPPEIEKMEELTKQIRTETYRMDMELIGSNPNPQISMEGESEDYDNYYNVVWNENGILGVRKYSKIIYHNVYPNIDWVIYTNKDGLKYDFVVNPGGEPMNIRIHYPFNEQINLENDGSLKIANRLGSISEMKPICIQGSKEIESNFILENGIVRFEIYEFNELENLIIDPALKWSTYYSGNKSSNEGTCSLDDSGNIYLSGITQSTTGIAFKGYQNSNSGYDDAYVVKFNSAGNRIWATYFGGSGEEQSISCDVSKLGEVFLAGNTNSAGLSNYQNVPFSFKTGGFIVKLNQSGKKGWSSYFTGDSFTKINGCKVDFSGNLYIVGRTFSTKYIYYKGHQMNIGGGGDAFLTKYNSNGFIEWSTYYGGNSADEGLDCSIDKGNNVYLGGKTWSANNISSGGHQNSIGGNIDAFLVKLDSNGNRIWGTYYGGNSSDEGYACCIDDSNNVYLTGYTSSTNNISYKGHQLSNGGGNSDGFLVKFNSAGVIQWGTFYGGNDHDYPSDCVKGAFGNILLVGTTRSTNGIAFNGYRNYLIGGGDVFLANFSKDGTRLWGTYYGGNDDEFSTRPVSSAIDKYNNMFVAGYTLSTLGIAQGGYQNTSAFGGSFLAKFNSNVDTKNINICTGGYYDFFGKKLTTGGNYDTTINSYTGNDSIRYIVNLTKITTPKLIFSEVPICGNVFGELKITNPFNNTPTKYDWSNGQKGVNKMSSLISQKYIVTSDNIYCPQKDSFTLTKINNCGGVIDIIADSIINYFDTLKIKVIIKGGDNMFSTFAKMTFRSDLLKLVSSQLGDYLGTSNLVHQPPVVTGNSIDFGMSRKSGAQGVNGDGDMYSFKFIVNKLPINVNPSNISYTDTGRLFKVDFSLNSIVCNDANGLQRNMRNDGPDSSKLRYRFHVWPGDLNNDLKCNVSDILPIGYFYNKTGSTRPNATIQWTPQQSYLWGVNNNSKTENAWYVFADGNGNGIIDLADQNSIGFNLNKAHKRSSNYKRPVYSTNSNPPVFIDCQETYIKRSSIPKTLDIPIYAGSLAKNVNNLYGIAVDLFVDPNVVDFSNVTLDFSTSAFGKLGSDFIEIDDIVENDGRISIGMTRYNTLELSGNPLLFVLKLPISVSAPDGYSYLDAVNIIANDKVGNDILLSPFGVKIGIGDTLKRKYTINITANPIAGGTVSGQGLYVVDSIAKVMAHAKPLWKFKNWTESSNILGTDTILVFAVTANRDLVANFELDKSFINTIMDQMNIHIYPNPVGTQLFIEFNPNAFSSVEILSIDGKNIIKRNIEENEEKAIMDLPNLAKGIYIVKLDNLYFKILKD